MNKREIRWVDFGRLLRYEAAREQEFKVPDTPHSDHAHRLLIGAGARVCPRCGLYVFPRDTSILYRCLNARAVSEQPPCEWCAR